MRRTDYAPTISSRLGEVRPDASTIGVFAIGVFAVGGRAP
jgi:hypothetical protein